MKNKSVNKKQNSCPKCRCKRLVSTGNMVSYPDHWEHWNCAHCNWLIQVIDNSPLITCFEFKKNGYVIDF